jgi:hypothetical protein
MSKTLKFLPLTFAAGPWGFNVFMPYLIAFTALAAMAHQLRRQRA